MRIEWKLSQSTNWNYTAPQKHESTLLHTYVLNIFLTQPFMYRVEKRIMPVEFFLNIYSMLQDINLKIGTDNSQVLYYDYFKA